MTSSEKHADCVCGFCGKSLTSRGLTRHLASCVSRKQAIEAANSDPGSEEDLLHLVVRDRWDSRFWLHLEAGGEVSLRELDWYLRQIWLECCNHMSQFCDEGWHGEPLPDYSIAEAFGFTNELKHIYDFGSSSYTVLKRAGARRGKRLKPHSILLIARNAMPDWRCGVCGEAATLLCPGCSDEEGFFCETHSAGHRHEWCEGFLPVANSPRLGTCAYCGPADPPY